MSETPEVLDELLEFQLEPLPDRDDTLCGLVHIAEDQKLPASFDFTWVPDLDGEFEKFQTQVYYMSEDDFGEILPRDTPSVASFIAHEDGLDIVLRDYTTDCKIYYKGVDISPIICGVKGGFLRDDLTNCVTLKVFVKSLDVKVTPKVGILGLSDYMKDSTE